MKDLEMSKLLGISKSGYKNMKCGGVPIPLYIEKSAYAHFQLWVVEQQTGKKLSALT